MRVAAGAVVSMLASAAWGQSFVNWESPHVHPLDLTPNGSKLLAVNTADNRLEIYNVTAGGLVPAGAVPVGLDPVSVRARTNTEAWVVNHVSDSVSIVNLTTLNVVQTIHPGDEPADVVFAGTPPRAFVSVSQENRVVVYDPADLSAPLASLLIEGEDPRELATDGDTVYAAIFESGNLTTVLFEGVVSNPSLNPYPGDPNPPPNSGTVFDPPFNETLPPPPTVGLILKKDALGVWRDDNGADWSAAVTWDLHDHDVAIIDAGTLAVTYATGTMNLNMSLSVRPDGEVIVVGTDAINHVRFEPNVQGIFVRVMGAVVSGPGEAAAVIDLNPHLDYSVPSVDQATRDLSIGDPRGIDWRAAGDRAYVSGMGSNNLVVVGPGLDRVGLVEVGEGPTGVVVDDAMGRVYVLNKFEGAISIVDAQGLTELDRVEYHDPTPVAVTAGRPHLYDTHKTSGLGQASCASCHVDGRMDQIAWDLGNPAGNLKPFNQTCSPPGACEDWHPMKGPLMTQTFQGIIGTEPLHWRGDRENLAAFNPAFVGLMGDVPLTPQEMTEFEDFVATITHGPNPFRTITNSLPNQILANGGNPFAGLQSFAARNCASCHPRPTGTNGVIPNSVVGQPQAFKNPPLRNQFEKTGFDDSSMNNNRGFGFLHDGSKSTLVDFFEFGFNFPAQENLDSEAFMLCFSTDTHAGVGKQVTLPEGESSPATDVPEMIGVAGTGAVGLVAHGRVGGEHRGYYLDGGAFQSDRAAEVISTAALEAAASAGGEIANKLVPQGSRIRIGVDRDLDAVFDGDEADAGSNPANPLSLPGNVPVAGNDQGTVVQGDPIAINVLANDSDGNGTVDPATVAISVPPAHGTITNIDSLTGAITYEHDGAAIATDSFTYRVRDNHGGFSNQATVQLGVVNEVLVDIALAGVSGSVSRCIRFELFDCIGEPLVEDTEVAFDNGAASGVRLEVPIGDYESMTAVDPLHSLVRAVTFGAGEPGHYAADFTDQSGGGGPDQSLLGGNANGDEFIDILDFGVFSGEWMATYSPSDCDTPPPQADFSGDGTVFTEDFTFIAINFLRQDDPASCPASDGPPGGPQVAYSVTGYAGHGLGRMAAADLNGDGWVDPLDVVAFLNGARPRSHGGGVPRGPVADPLIAAGGSMPADLNLAQSMVIDSPGATAANVVIEDRGDLRIAGGSLEATSVTVQAGGRLSLSGGALSATELIVERGGTLEVSGAKALVRVGSLVLREGAVLLWQGGVLEVVGGVFRQADRDLVVGRTMVESTLRLVNGATAAISGDTFIGIHRGGRGAIEVIGSTFSTGDLLSVGQGGEGSLEISGGGSVSSSLGEVGGSGAGQGLVIVSGPGSTWRNQGRLEVGVKGTGDVWLLEQGELVANEVAIGSGGSVAGNGLVAATLVNGGTLRPGNGLGAMTIDGDYRQAAEGALEVEIGAAEYDTLRVDGGAMLSGRLVLAVKDGYVPRAGAEFVIVAAGQVQGRFDGVVAPRLPSGRQWVVRYGSGGATVVVVPGEKQ